MTILNLEDICFSYPGQAPILDGVALRLEPGSRDIAISRTEVLIAQGRTAEALAILQNSLRLFKAMDTAGGNNRCAVAGLPNRTSDQRGWRQ